MVSRKNIPQQRFQLRRVEQIVVCPSHRLWGHVGSDPAFGAKCGLPCHRSWEIVEVIQLGDCVHDADGGLGPWTMEEIVEVCSWRLHVFFEPSMTHSS